MVRFAGHNPKTFLGLSAGSVAGWKYFVNDESLLEQATEVALGDDASKGLKENGVTGGLKVSPLVPMVPTSRLARMWWMAW